ncbi:MAG: selenocysteine-specific translation elongation factor [Gammaproteobacteria bacterium]|nr:selenocysteine-specific translation elongation factor [Gammaproteobacteria bacterium]MDE0368391.1 selenocysteine-specific translation elongation factor [Gammaproteobacteria bacterium]
MIVTLAGHVDHGKTSLVKAITGVDTDTLREERQRGLTIDLGFAYAVDGKNSGDVLGFVDVPGHHRFIHNMVAGVAAMQYALLAVAADDGPMPQSREHLQILELTGLRQGVVALTKCDRVSPERVLAAERETRALLAGTFLEDADVIKTSAQTGLGITKLTEALWAAHRAQQRSIPERGFRLAVDRAFIVRGSGLVVTGTVHSGRIERNQEVSVFPTGEKARVRGLRAQDQTVDSAGAGDRTALNLAGIDAQGISRGCWLMETPSPMHRNFAVDLRVVEDFPRPVKHWLPVHVYHATTHSTAHLALLRPGRLEPGQRAEVELVTDEPLCARHGDPVVVRDQGLDRTLGGGPVLTDLPSTSRRRRPQRLARIAAFQRDDPKGILGALIELGPLETEPLEYTLGMTNNRLQAILDDLDADRRGTAMVGRPLWRRWRAAALEFIEGYQAAHPDRTGARPNQLPSDIPATYRLELLNELVAEKALGVTAGAYHPPRHVASLPETERALLDRVQPLLDVDQAPSVGDLAKELRTPIAVLDRGLKSLARRGLLVQVSAKRFYWPERLRQIAGYAADLAARGPFTVRSFRDSTGIGRNIAIEVLEYFDGRGFTRRTGDTRLVVKAFEL